VRRSIRDGGGSEGGGVSNKRYAAKVDANQPEIVKQLRAAGYGVHLPCDDILVGRDGVNLWVEIKQPGKEGQLTESEKKRLEGWPGAYIVASSFDDIHHWFIGKGR
jgi:uncharacterized protein YebE (UPF0316 family)